MKRKAFGAIDLLIGLVIVALVAVVGLGLMKGSSVLKLNNSNSNTQDVQKYVDQKVGEIGDLKQQSIDYNKMMLEEEEKN